MKLALGGDINATPRNAEATFGPVEGLIEYRQLTIAASGEIGLIQFDGSEEVEDLVKPSRPSAALHLVGPSVDT